MSKSILMCVCVCACLFGCSETTSPKDPSGGPKEPRSRDAYFAAPKDDIILVVSPAWHPGKEYSLTQSLRANPVKKEKLVQKDTTGH